MSFILDALKKSENERQQQSGGEFSAVPTGGTASGTPRWIWVLAVLLAINIAVLLGLLMRPDVRSTSETAMQTSAPTESLQQVAEEQPVAEATSFESQVAEARRQQPAATSAPIEETASANLVPATTPAAPSPSSSSERVPTIEELRLNGSLQLPDLHIDIHVYSDSPADRFVFINMSKYREQAQLDEGPVVREITTDGVILQYQGRSFLLSRE